MTSFDHLVPFVRRSDECEDAAATIRSVSLEGAWRVPLSLVRMEVHEIIRLALAVSSTPATPQDYAATTADVHPLSNDDPPQLAGDDQSAVCISLEQPPTASEATTLQEYQKLMALGSVFALIKYWVFMRMLWRHDGESDRVVINVMAHSENMKQPTPLRNAKNRKRWTIVRHGLSLMEILLNNRPLLLEVMRNRHLSFTNLICLRSDYLTRQQPAAPGGENSASDPRGAGHTWERPIVGHTLCPLSSRETASLSQNRSLRRFSRAPLLPPLRQPPADVKRNARGKNNNTTSYQGRSARERSATLGVQSTKKRKRHSSIIAEAEREERDAFRDRQATATKEDAVDDSDSKEENIVEDTLTAQQQRQQMDEQSGEDVVQASLVSASPSMSSSPSATGPGSSRLRLDRLRAALCADGV